MAMANDRSSAYRLWLTGLVSLAAGAVLANLSFIGTAASASVRHAKKSVTAEQFVLVDKDGTQRAVLEVGDKGMAYLAITDQNGKNRTEMRVSADGGAGLGFYDDHGRKRIVVGETGGGKAGIGIYDQNGKQVAGLAVSPNGEAGLTLLDRDNGLARAGLGIAANGAPALVLFDDQGKDRAELYVNAKGPGLALADAKGKTIAGLPPGTTRRSAPPPTP
jgi:hypothetical protein